MAKYFVEDTSLTAVADAIRTKGGTSEALSFPDGFVSAVEGIQAGGGGVELVEQILTKTVVNLNLPGLEHISPQNGSSIVTSNLFSNNPNLISISMPDVKDIEGNSLFSNCTNLETVDLPSVAFLNANGMFEGCVKIKELRFPSLQNSPSVSMKNCTELEIVDYGWKGYGGGWPRIGGNQYSGCSKLNTVILRTDKFTWSLQNISAFNGTPFASGGAGGTVYCPASLIEQYQQATNWSTLYAAGTCSFVAIEGSEYE